MTANPSDNFSAWARLERGRQAKASSGGYAGYGSPAFGQRISVKRVLDRLYGKAARISGVVSHVEQTLAAPSVAVSKAATENH